MRAGFVLQGDDGYHHPVLCLECAFSDTLVQKAVDWVLVLIGFYCFSIQPTACFYSPFSCRT
ncbi:hypothetical protein PAHA111176_14650 [Parendozoicomonas haliclonae]|uniref:Uncharacterized protein n=1 Tax=Parendozoicomonas haliclonae TaxID=1960125 RepID=A0A1X7AJX4_9GAMM|nr:hypothetical protein EHSB41UT_01453 [Parendozoicomonas haliclonae]